MSTKLASAIMNNGADSPCKSLHKCTFIRIVYFYYLSSIHFSSPGITEEIRKLFTTLAAISQWELDLDILIPFLLFCIGLILSVYVWWIWDSNIKRPMGGAVSELTTAQLFSQKQTLHEAPRHPRGRRAKYTVSAPSLGFWGLWVLPCRFSPPWAAGIQEGSCPLLSAHSVSWRGFWTGPWLRFLTLHMRYRASPPSCAPRSLCLPQTCFISLTSSSSRGLTETSAAVQGCISLESWHWQSWIHSPLCLKYNIDQCTERWAQEGWIPTGDRTDLFERGHC